jgi:hypothetical protein
MSLERNAEIDEIICIFECDDEGLRSEVFYQKLDQKMKAWYEK